MERLLLRIQTATGWRRAALAFFGGVLMTLTLPPVYALPLLIPAFGILYLLVEAAPTAKRSFADGWWWGMGWHMTGLYWFCIALLTDPEKFAWLIPFALIGLNAIIALYAGLACWLYKKIKTYGISKVFIFASVWMLVEYARGHLFSGFPWNLAGYSFTATDALLQLASVIGIYGMTWLAVFLALIPFLYFDSSVGRKKSLLAIVVPYLLFVIAAGWGHWRLQEAPEITMQNYDPPIKMRLVQASIEQNLKWESSQRRAGVEEHIRLTNKEGVENISTFIWPETALPYIVRSGDPLLQHIGSSIPKGSHVITGALRAEGNQDDWRVYNSMVMINSNGDIVGSYDKIQLVPFGEFVPFRDFLPKSWLTPAGEKDFSRGRNIEVKQWPNLPSILPLICYEVIFPEFISKASQKPEWLLNITNDAWFGDSSGPHQHFQMARVRAVEQGLPLVRVANNGITAIVDGYGRIISKMGHNEKGILDISLTKPVKNVTIYNIMKDYVLEIVLLLGTVLITGQRFYKQY